jgi:hypothetical protein
VPDGEDCFSRDFVAVDTTAGKVGRRREYPNVDVEAVAEPSLIGVFERRLLARTWTTRRGRPPIVWPVGRQPRGSRRLPDRGGGGVAASWRLYRLRSANAPAGTPLFEMSGGVPEAVAAEGNCLFGRLRKDVTVLTVVLLERGPCPEIVAPVAATDPLR